MAKKVKDATIANGALLDVYLVCEGEGDKSFLAALIQKILKRNHADIGVAIVSAHGKQPIPRLVQALDDEMRGDSRIGIVIDSDNEIEETRSFLSRNLDLERYFVVIAHPSLESWLGKKAGEIKQWAMDPERMSRIVGQLDLDELERKHPEAAILRENLTRRAINTSLRRSTIDLVHSHS